MTTKALRQRVIEQKFVTSNGILLKVSAHCRAKQSSNRIGARITGFGEAVVRVDLMPVEVRLFHIFGYDEPDNDDYAVVADTLYAIKASEADSQQLFQIMKTLRAEILANPSM